MRTGRHLAIQLKSTPMIQRNEHLLKHTSHAFQQSPPSNRYVTKVSVTSLSAKTKNRRSIRGWCAPQQTINPMTLARLWNIAPFQNTWYAEEKSPIYMYKFLLTEHWGTDRTDTSLDTFSRITLCFNVQVDDGLHDVSSFFGSHFCAPKIWLVLNPAPYWLWFFYFIQDFTRA